MDHRSLKSISSRRNSSFRNEDVRFSLSRSLNNRRHDSADDGDSVIAFLKFALFSRPRIQVEPAGKLFFMYEPGKQTTSVVRLKNISSSYVAFKFQTNAPKSCFMRPPNGILAPKETLLASVVKFVEPPEQSQNKSASGPPSTTDKFKILSMKVEECGDYTPDLFEQNKENTRVEGLLRVVFLDPQRPSKDLEKLKQRIAEAEAIRQATKKTENDKSTKQSSLVASHHPPGGAVLDEWREQRERYLAKLQREEADVS